MQTTTHAFRAAHPPVLVAAALALVLAACGGGDGSPSGGGGGAPSAGGESQSAANETVEISGLAFGTSELTIDAGTTVTFVNEDGVPHTVTHGSDGTPADDAAFDESLPGGEEVTITFDEPGTYPITCTIHPSMNMTVVVQG